MDKEKQKKDKKRPRAAHTQPFCHLPIFVLFLCVFFLSFPPCVTRPFLSPPVVLAPSVTPPCFILPHVPHTHHLAHPSHGICFSFAHSLLCPIPPPPPPPPEQCASRPRPSAPSSPSSRWPRGGRLSRARAALRTLAADAPRRVQTVSQFDSITPQLPPIYRPINTCRGCPAAPIHCQLPPN